MAVFGLGLGVLFAVMFPQNADVGLLQSVVAPTAEEYTVAAGEILLPFMVRATAMTSADFGNTNEDFRAMVTDTQEQLLNLRVPGDFREAHISAVILLDKWKVALNSTDADQSVLLAKTKLYMDEHPWISGGPLDMGVGDEDLAI